jgi:hypothetical protein
MSSLIIASKDKGRTRVQTNFLPENGRLGSKASPRTNT